MKYSILIILVLALSSCWNRETTISQFNLSNGDVIKLIVYKDRPLGATFKSSLYVKRIFKDGNSVLMGQIQGFTRGYRPNFMQMNDSLLKIRLTDTLIFKGEFVDFIANLNRHIEPNEVPPYIERQ